MEPATVSVQNNGKNYTIVYTCDEALVSGSIDRPGGKVRFTGHDLNGAKYGYTSQGELPSHITLSTGTVRGSRYTVPVTGGDPGPYM